MRLVRFSKILRRHFRFRCSSCDQVNVVAVVVVDDDDDSESDVVVVVVAVESLMALTYLCYLYSY